MPKPSRFKRRLPRWTALILVAVYIVIALWLADAESYASLSVVAPLLLLVSIALLIYAIIRKVRQSLWKLLSAVAALWLASVAMFYLSGKLDIATRTTTVWLARSRNYKAEVLAQPSSRNGDFKHIEWDGWGYAPAGYSAVYLVFDPSDSLSVATKRRRPGKLAGIPCEVYKVNRLEKNWYAVLFHTDQDWNHCE